MKTILLVLLVISAVSYKYSPTNRKIFYDDINSHKITRKVNGEIYTVSYDDSTLTIKVLTQDGQVLFNKTAEDGIGYVIFTDFNGDGYKDILIDYRTNIPGIQDLLLYDKYKKTFNLVAHFDRYPDVKRLGNTGFYYSYHRSGCADNNWDSDLFSIMNSKIIKLGNINGIGCEDSNHLGIFVYRFDHKHKYLLEKMSMSLIDNYKDGKWGFISHYWKSHYSNFK